MCACFCRCKAQPLHARLDGTIIFLQPFSHTRTSLPLTDIDQDIICCVPTLEQESPFSSPGIRLLSFTRYPSHREHPHKQSPSHPPPYRPTTAPPTDRPNESDSSLTDH
jgi:hypothetical protein